MNYKTLPSGYVRVKGLDFMRNKAQMKAMLILSVLLVIVPAALGLILGVLLMTAVMLAWNYIITPLYMHVPREVVAGMLIPTFLPFNLVKGGLNAGITMLVYKPLVSALRKAHLLAPSESTGGRRQFNLTATLVSAFVVVTCVIVFILMTK